MAARADGLLPRRALLVLFQKIGRNQIGTRAGTEVWDPGFQDPGSGIRDLMESGGIWWNLWILVGSVDSVGFW